MTKSIEQLADEADSIPTGNPISYHFGRHLLDHDVSIPEIAKQYIRKEYDAYSAYEGFLGNAFFKDKIRSSWPHLDVLSALYKAGYPARAILKAVYNRNSTLSDQRVVELGLEILEHLGIQTEEKKSILRSFRLNQKVNNLIEGLK